TPFEEPTGHQALAPEIIRLLACVDFLWPLLRGRINAVKVEHEWRLLRDVHRFRSGELHFGGEFVAANARIEPAVVFSRNQMLAIDLRHQRMRRSFACRRDKITPFICIEIRNGILSSGINDRSGMLRGQERGIPILWTV